MVKSRGQGVFPKNGTGNVPENGRKPVGRPPATSSLETRRRILAAARTCFGRYGYDKTTNKDIAAAANITAGAIYHYFPSKQSLFVATLREVQGIVFEAFDRAVEGKTTLTDMIKAVMDTAAELHVHDRSLAVFTANAPVEIQRHDEVRRELGDDALLVFRFFQRLVSEAAKDLSPDVDRDSIVDLLVAVTTGFAQFGATTKTVGAHRIAIESFKRLLEGTVFVAPDGSDTKASTRVAKNI